MTNRIALVTGVGRELGLGFAVCRALAARGLTVVLTARDGAAARALAPTIGADALALDVTDGESVKAATSFIASRYGRLDALVNNAAYGIDADTPSLDVSVDEGRAAIEVNVLGTWRLTQAMAPLLREARGRVVNVSSGAGSFGAPDGIGAFPRSLITYCVSKAALNALTVKLAGSFEGTGVLVNAVCPGHTATYEGAEENGARPTSESAVGIVWAATLDEDGPTGGFFRDQKPIPW